MESKIINLNNFKIMSGDLKKTSSKINLGEVCVESPNFFLNPLNLFMALFNNIPNVIGEIKIDCKRAVNWFVINYKSEIKDLYFNKRYFLNSKSAEYNDIFLVLFDDLIVHFNIKSFCVKFLFRKTDISIVETVINEVKKFKERKSKRQPLISVIVNAAHGFETRFLEIKKPKLNIEDNYNDDFAEIHQTIVKRLSKKNDKGLVLLHGKPGTGKTSYIRYLIATLKKNVFFLPPNMAGAITNPDLLSVLTSNTNSVFVIEDAENIIVDREKDGHSHVSALLNISDGLLSDCLNIQIICSFNTDISKIDSALMRKGRLIARYEFKDLEIEKAQSLSDKLGYTNIINSPMNLTSIYNQEEKDFIHQKRISTIGFRAITSYV